MSDFNETELQCVDCGVYVRGLMVQLNAWLCNACERARGVAAVAEFKIGTYVAVAGKPGEVVGHGARLLQSKYTIPGNCYALTPMR